MSILGDIGLSVKSKLNLKQDTLVSGTNIKTINGSSILGSGDITISVGATLTNDSTTNSNFYPVFTTSTSGTMTAASVSSTNLYFNPSTGILNATQFNAFSDERLKENIKTIDNSLEKVNKLRGVNFNFKNSDTTMGLIAQEVKNIIPEVVDDKSDYMSVNYNALIGLLVESIKELSEKVNILESKLK